MSYLYYYRYPQFVWAKRIAGLIASGTLGDARKLRFVDAPCGDGIISYWLRRQLEDLDISLFDIDNSLVEIARKRIPGVRAEVQSIFDLKVEPRTIWLLINSLYCLPDKELLMKSMGSQVDQIIAVFPDIEEDNYRTFLRQHPGFDNPSAMTRQQTLAFFAAHGFRPIVSEDASYASQFRFQDFGMGPIMKRALNVVEPLVSQPNGQYWLAVFDRDVASS